MANDFGGFRLEVTYREGGVYGFSIEKTMHIFMEHADADSLKGQVDYFLKEVSKALKMSGEYGNEPDVRINHMYTDEFKNSTYEAFIKHEYGKKVTTFVKAKDKRSERTFDDMKELEKYFKTWIRSYINDVLFENDVKIKARVAI